MVEKYCIPTYVGAKLQNVHHAQAFALCCSERAQRCALFEVQRGAKYFSVH